MTVEQFAAFVEATSHVTDAEKFQWSFVLEYVSCADKKNMIDDDDVAAMMLYSCMDLLNMLRMD